MPTDVTGLVVEVLATEDPGTSLAGLVVELLLTDVPDPGMVDVSGALLEVLVANVPSPRDPEISRYISIAEKRFGKDLVLSYPDLTVPATATGDWPVIAGRPNLHAAMRRRLVTCPGQMVTRPAYGAGMELFVGELNDPSERARLAAAARQNVLRDPRIAEAIVSVESPDAGRVVLQLNMRPSGEVEDQTVIVVGDA